MCTEPDTGVIIVTLVPRSPKIVASTLRLLLTATFLFHFNRVDTPVSSTFHICDPVNRYLTITYANQSKKTLTFCALNDVALSNLALSGIEIDSWEFRYENIVSHCFPVVLIAIQVTGVFIRNLTEHSQARRWTSFRESPYKIDVICNNYFFKESS